MQEKRGGALPAPDGGWPGDSSPQRGVPPPPPLQPTSTPTYSSDASCIPATPAYSPTAPQGSHGSRKRPLEGAAARPWRVQAQGAGTGAFDALLAAAERCQQGEKQELLARGKRQRTQATQPASSRRALAARQCAPALPQGQRRLCAAALPCSSAVRQWQAAVACGVAAVLHTLRPEEAHQIANVRCFLAQF